ncbi:hypothetical protein A6302_02516 [Methylobrevis pamukkalensis]|uniref:Uncharacterized protein n=1 Tax=Methylobrevis pamukkalensis TaxID=1439726 RepID=A0A1E3H1K4_9HYPH|nr:hypothetical protein A6302_02516 [Methylobrevis pamukkalensis]
MALNVKKLTSVSVIAVMAMSGVARATRWKI